MEHQLSNTMYDLEFAMEEDDFERLKSSSIKKRNDFVADPMHVRCNHVLNLNRYCFPIRKIFFDFGKLAQTTTHQTNFCYNLIKLQGSFNKSLDNLRYETRSIEDGLVLVSIIITHQTAVKISVISKSLQDGCRIYSQRRISAIM